VARNPQPNEQIFASYSNGRTVRTWEVATPGTLKATATSSEKDVIMADDGAGGAGSSENEKWRGKIAS